MKTRNELVAELQEIAERSVQIDQAAATPEQVEALDADLARAEAIEAEVAALDARAARLAKVTAAATSARTESGVGTTGPAFHTRSTERDIYDPDTMRTASVHDLRERALSAIETNRNNGWLPSDQVEAATRQIERAGYGTEKQGKLAEYVLLTGSPAYEDQFNEFLRSQGRQFGPDLQRAAMSLTTANGGAMVPYVLDPAIMLTNNGTNNPVRQVARVETIIGANEWRGVTSAGVTAEWLAEGTEAADASPTFAQPAIPTFKGSAYLFGSYEVLADSGFASQVQPLIMDAKDRLEATAFTTGTGSGQPEGWVTGKVAAGSLQTSTTADTFARGDVDKTMAGLAPRWRTSRASWQANVSVQNLIRQFDTAGGSSLWAQLGAGTPAQLMGFDIRENSDMDGTITAAAENYVLGFGDWKAAYIIVDRVGLEIYYDNLVLGTNRRPTGQAGFFAFWRVGGEVVVPQAISLLNVT